MLPPVVVPWIRISPEGESDYTLHTLVVRPTGAVRIVKDLTPRAPAPNGRWIGISSVTQKILTIGPDGSTRPARLSGPFMSEPDYGGELAINPGLGLAALASRGTLRLQRWQNGAGTRLVGTLTLPEGERLEQEGAAWDSRGRLAIGAHDGRGWLYAYGNGRMRLVGRPRFGGVVIGWIGDRLLVHQNFLYTSESGLSRPRLVTAEGKTISAGPAAFAAGTDGRVILLVVPQAGRRERWREALSWQNSRWHALTRPVALPTAKGGEYDTRVLGTPLIAIGPAPSRR